MVAALPCVQAFTKSARDRQRAIAGMSKQASKRAVTHVFRLTVSHFQSSQQLVPSLRQPLGQEVELQQRIKEGAAVSTMNGVIQIGTSRTGVDAIIHAQVENEHTTH